MVPPTAEPRVVEYRDESSPSTFVVGGVSPLRVLINCISAVLELDFTGNIDDP